MIWKLNAKTAKRSLSLGKMNKNICQIVKLRFRNIVLSVGESVEQRKSKRESAQKMKRESASNRKKLVRMRCFARTY